MNKFAPLIGREIQLRNSAHVSRRSSLEVRQEQGCVDRVHQILRRQLGRSPQGELWIRRCSPTWCPNRCRCCPTIQPRRRTTSWRSCRPPTSGRRAGLSGVGLACDRRNLQRLHHLRYDDQDGNGRDDRRRIGQRPVTLGVATDLIRGDIFWGEIMAGALLASVPVAIAYNFFLDRSSPASPAALSNRLRPPPLITAPAIVQPSGAYRC
jgi:hypothetical protein